MIFDRNCRAKVTISSVAPRGDDKNPDLERQELNLKFLKWSHEEENVCFIDNSNLALRGKINEKLYAADKVHLNMEGAKLFSSNLSFNLKEQLGLSLYTNQESHGPRRGLQRRGRRGNFYNNGHRQRPWSPP